MSTDVTQSSRADSAPHSRETTGRDSGSGDVRLLDSVEAWQRFVSESVSASFFYSPAWCQLLADVFGHSYYCLSTLVSTEGNTEANTEPNTEANTEASTEASSDNTGSGAAQVTGILPLVHVNSRLFGSRLVSLPFCNWGGPISSTRTDDARLVTAARELAGSLGARNLELRADRELDCGAPARRHKVRMVLELPESREAFQASLAGKVRSQARRPLRAGATFSTGGAAEVDAFYDVFARNMRDLGTPVLPVRFFRELVERFPEKVRIVLVHVDAEPVAAGVIVRNGSRMEIPWAASLREANRLGVNMLLYSEAIGYAIETGCKEFDFGRSTENSGTFKFKRQWGAQPEGLYWYAWQDDQPDAGPGLSPDNPGFGLAIRVWQRLPVRLTRVLGPPLARNLP